MSLWRVRVGEVNDDINCWLISVGCLRTFLVDRYLSTSDFGEPKYWDVEAADYVVAVRSIQATPATDFDRGQRARLANRVLRILLVANMSKLARITDHLILLAGLIQMPNKSIELLTNDAERSKKGSTQPKDEAALISLARRIDGVVGWSEDNVHSVRALRQLARLVMRYETRLSYFRTADTSPQLPVLDTRSEEQHPVPTNILCADGPLSRVSLQE